LGVSEGLDEEVCLLFDALLDATFANSEVPQRGDREAPELFGPLPVAKGYA
jgi:hypothetical protein